VKEGGNEGKRLGEKKKHGSVCWLSQKGKEKEEKGKKKKPFSANLFIGVEILTPKSDRRP
jgi:hypothetical protein